MSSVQMSWPGQEPPKPTSIDDLVGEAVMQGMVAMQLAMHDGSRDHHEKVLAEFKSALRRLLVAHLDLDLDQRQALKRLMGRE